MMFEKKEIGTELRDKLKRYVYDVVGCCQDVHREQGPELTEYIYQDSLAIAFEQAISDATHAMQVFICIK